MQFTVQPVFLVNFFIIAVGIGVCALCIVCPSAESRPAVFYDFFLNAPALYLHASGA